MREVAGRLLALVVLVTLAVGVWQYERHLNGIGGDGRPVNVVVLVPPAQARWVGMERDRFNVQYRGQYAVTLTVREPGAAMKEILAGQLQPAACGADDVRWLKRLIALWAAGHKGAHIAAFDDSDDYYVYFQSPSVAETTAPGQKPHLTAESDTLAAAATNGDLRVTYPKRPRVTLRCAATLSAPWVTSDQRDGAQTFLKFLATRSALQDGLRDHWRPVRGDAQLTLAPELRRYARQGFRENY